MKLSRLKPDLTPLPHDYLKIFPTVSLGTLAPQIFKKIDVGQTGGHFQGSPHYELQISLRNTLENRNGDVMPESKVSFLE